MKLLTLLLLVSIQVISIRGFASDSQCVQFFQNIQNNISILKNGEVVENLLAAELFGSVGTPIPFNQIKLQDPIFRINISNTYYGVHYYGKNIEADKQEWVEDLMRRWMAGLLTGRDALQYISLELRIELKDVTDSAVAAKIFERNFFAENQITDASIGLYVEPRDRRTNPHGIQIYLNTDGILKSIDWGTTPPGLYAMSLLTQTKEGLKHRRIVFTLDET